MSFLSWDDEFNAIMFATGHGARLRAKLPKLWLKFGGRRLLEWHALPFSRGSQLMPGFKGCNDLIPPDVAVSLAASGCELLVHQDSSAASETVARLSSLRTPFATHESVRSRSCSSVSGSAAHKSRACRHDGVARVVRGFGIRMFWRLVQTSRMRSGSTIAEERR